MKGLCLFVLSFLIECSINFKSWTDDSGCAVCVRLHSFALPASTRLLADAGEEAEKGRLTTEGNESKRNESKLGVRHRISFQFNPVAGVGDAQSVPQFSDFADRTFGDLLVDLWVGDGTGSTINLYGPVDGRRHRRFRRRGARRKGHAYRSGHEREPIFRYRWPGRVCFHRYSAGNLQHPCRGAESRNSRAQGHGVGRQPAGHSRFHSLSHHCL